MPNHSLDDLIIKPQPLTGRMRSFVPTTPWLDGNAPSDAIVNGVQVIKAGSTYYREAYPTGETHRVNVLELGLVPDGVTRNEQILADAMSRLPQNTTFFFPASTQPYVFGPLPSKYNNFNGDSVAINCDSSGAWFVGEGDNSTIQLLANTAGFQVNGGLAPRLTVFRDLNIVGPGRGAGSDGVNPDGSPSPEPEDYSGNGINAYGQVLLDNVNISGCSGHGVKIFGFPAQDIPPQEGLPFSVKGHMDEDTNAFYFYPNDINDVAKVYNWKVVYQGIETKVGSLEQANGRLGIEKRPGMTASNPAVISITPVGGPLLADNSDIFGGNFDFNGGCGIYIRGADANQTRIWGGSMRENGNWGLFDYSFLGTFCYGTHFTKNGKSFNETETAVKKLVVGPYYTKDPNARSGYFGVYTEGGNQGKAYIAQNTQVIGGLNEAGVEGPGFTLLGAYANNLRAGNVHFNELGMLFYDNGGQPVTFRQWPWGLGYGFGNPENGQVPHPFLSFVADGSPIVDPNDANQVLRHAKTFGIHIPTLYQGPFCHLVAPGLYQALLSVGNETMVQQGDTISLFTGTDLLTPSKYTCYKSGTALGADPDTRAKWRPEGYGIGPVAERPDAGLTPTDAGWRWYDPATNEYTTFNGTQWG
jgi:hypothetical protein